MAEALYLENEYMKEFDANIKCINKLKENKYEVYLDKTAFYPEKGGQPCDLGTINGVKVIDVVEKDNEIVHIIEAPLGPNSGEVHCVIDWNRRFENMQQHAGQHLLAAAFIKAADGYTVSMHIGSEVNTIDVDKEEITPEDVINAEQLANSIVFENRKINKFIVDGEEVKKLPLRKTPKVNENIRIVEIEDFDMSPCGGTHPKFTGEIGLIKVLKSEKYKKMTRIEFVCGIRALNDYEVKNEIIKKMCAQLSSKPEKLIQNVDKQNNEKKQLQEIINEYSEKLCRLEAKQIAFNASKVHCNIIIKTFEDKKLDELKKLSEILALEYKVNSIFGLEGAKKQIVVTKSEGIKADISKAVRALGIRGGGNDTVFQGVVDDFNVLDNVAKIFSAKENEQ